VWEQSSPDALPFSGTDEAKILGAGKKTGLSEIWFIGNGHIGNRYI
jgi:hypothetical protein